MAADFNKPTVDDPSYINVLASIREQFQVVSTMSYGNAVPGSLPTGTVQFLDGRMQKWDGSAFVNSPIGISGGGTGASTAAGARVALNVPSLDDLSNDYLSKSGNLSGITDPSLARQVLDVYSESEVDDAISVVSDALDGLFSTEVVNAPSGDLISGGLKISKAGNTVTISNTSGSGFSHASNQSPDSTTGFIPAGLRPQQTAFNCYYNSFGDSRSILVQSGGKVSFFYTDVNGNPIAKTSTGSFSISYTV
jgi:hypothetical protein